MKTPLALLTLAALLSWTCAGQEGPSAKTSSAGVVAAHAEGLHGYIGFGHDRPPSGSGYHAGMGFYAAVWPLIDQPLADFQIGLPSSWATPGWLCLSPTPRRVTRPPATSVGPAF